MDQPGLCLQDLAALTGGKLLLAAMPPRDGELALVRRLVVHAEQVGEGDIYWCLYERDGSIELAYLRGALGVVCQRFIEPWPGRFSLCVDDPGLALSSVLAAEAGRQNAGVEQVALQSRRAQKDSGSILPELKGLQLCAGGGVDIYSPTCGRVVNELHVHRCRRRAA